ncbi:MAG: T9SS type A sorting domain-containing protein [Bacteroidales bacterium]|nr:T9SS type A sorting domain-containing protein [Bacteroidales bacterium]MCF8454519.1 T9SS type A sorting domain-containing protein [Bacteroidales bacterium]
MKKILLILSTILLSPCFLNAQTVLVDFGAATSNNVFGMPGWNNLLLSNNMVYLSPGGSGVSPQSNLDEFTDYMGVSGPSAFNFQVNHRVVVTWYNNSNQTFNFSARISFSDTDYPDSGTATGNWFTMRSFTNYQHTYSEALPYSLIKTVFNIVDQGVHACTGNHNSVNVNLHIEWFDSSLKPNLICDKIELYDDADTSAPAQPTNLQAVVLSDSKIALSWNVPTDNVAVTEYYVYKNGEMESYSRINADTIYFLEPATSYAFQVTALDNVLNESAPSQSITVSTMAFQGDTSLINPSVFEYAGAFRFPDNTNWGADALAYNPNGDGGLTGSGSSDGHPGSLFTSNINTPSDAYIGEFNIPGPVIPTPLAVDSLPQATQLQGFSNIRPANINNYPYVDVWVNDIAWLPAQGAQTNAKLYSAWGYYYQLMGETKYPALSWCDAQNLAGSTKQGGWYLGSPTGWPEPAYCNDYLFPVPQLWADANTNGRSLLNGRYREGGLSGLGPTLYAIAPWQSGNPPAVGETLSYTTLLEYGPVLNSVDDYYYPNAINDYNHADYWKDAVWLKDNSKNAVAIVGLKGLGVNYYGYKGEQMRHEWVIADLPYPEFYATDPNGKGWQAGRMAPIMVLYKPQDLADVAAGVQNSYDIQPYAAMRFDPGIFYSDHPELRSAAFDRENEILYITEFCEEYDGRAVVHVWTTSSVIVDIENYHSPERRFIVYPNPSNGYFQIEIATGLPGKFRIEIYNTLGKNVCSGFREKEACSQISLYPSEKLMAGVYYLQVWGCNGKHNELIGSRRIVVVD